MGAEQFEEYGIGKTPKEAFQYAHGQACHEYGHGGYTGSLAEKGSFVEIPVPKEWADRPYDYAQHLMDIDDKRIRDKWGPAGCILINSKSLVDKVAYATTTERYKQEGTRQWKTVYKITGPNGYMRFEDSQTKAEQVAKDYAKAHNETMQIFIEKQLVNGSQKIMTIAPKTKDVPSKDTMNKYLFFGWASS